MKENVRFYKCPVCGNIVGLIEGDMEHITHNIICLLQ